MFDFVSWGRGGRILNVGSGSTPHFNSQTVNLDIKPYPNVDVVADAHQLPFPDASFDSVICSAVLEHAERPWTVASEIRRVLKVGGAAIIQAPFLEGVHDEHDYFRFTQKGLVSLFPGFRIVKQGVSAGPVQILAQLVQVNTEMVVEGTILEKPVKVIMSWLVKPIQWGDLQIKHSNRKTDTVSRYARGVYFVGRKL
jgi:SAM-dependent methyltransferase